MAHNIQNFAFTGDRKDIWHGLGTVAQSDWTVQRWANAAGLEHNVTKVPALAVLPNGSYQVVPDRYWLLREDSNVILSSNTVSDRYQVVQPRESLEFFTQYIEQDDRFKRDTAASLKRGEIIFATAVFQDSLTVAGDKHKARLLFTTTYDGSGATVTKALMTRVVCNNTLDAGLAEKGATIRTVHSTKFDADKVRKELAAVVSGFAKYKAMGDAMAQTVMADRELVDFFKTVLDIPLDAKKEDVSTRRFNQYKAIFESWRTTATETEGATAWGALNAVTRYADHDRSASKSEEFSGEAESRFYSANFAAGADLKAKAWQLLMPRIADKVTVDA